MVDEFEQAAEEPSDPARLLAQAYSEMQRIAGERDEARAKLEWLSDEVERAVAMLREVVEES